MRNPFHSRAALTSAPGLILLLVSAAAAEIPDLSAEQLERQAESIITGTLVHTYHRKETKGDYEYTHSLAEIVVDGVRKGQDIEAGDRVYVRYWRKRFVGNGRPETGHFGHRGVPNEGTHVLLFLEGDRADGFDVLSPNGIAALPTGTPRRDADDE